MQQQPGNESIAGLGWFRTVDPNSVSLTSSDGRLRLDLLLVPPASEQALFEQTVAGCSSATIAIAASPTLAAVTANLASARTDKAAETAWESEGGPGHSSSSRLDDTEKP